MDPQPFVMIHTTDQWCRAAHENTALADNGGGCNSPGRWRIQRRRIFANVQPKGAHGFRPLVPALSGLSV